MSSNKVVLSVKGLKKNFGDLHVLKDFNLEVHEGEVISIIGPSGTGKSTILRCINYLEKPTEGVISIDGITVDAHNKADKKKVHDLRCKTSMVFQNYNLFKNMTALQNVMEPMVKVQKMPKEDAVQKAMERAEYYFDRQNSFIGNASHELQTPLAILGTRLEWLMNSDTLSEEQMTEIIKMQRSLSRLVRLNRTLLLLSKIENGQFPETTEVDVAAIIRENIEIYSEIYADREISCTLQLPDGFKVSMNESLATTLISNLLKNSFVHNSNGGCVKVSIDGNTLTVANSGKEPLDASRIFERFYHKGNSDSTGLGLPLVSSIAERYGTKVEYSFADGMHCFSIKFMQ